jgi:hypothetical protein
MRVEGIRRALWIGPDPENPLLILADTFEDVSTNEPKMIQFFLNGGLQNSTWFPLTGRLEHRRNNRWMVMRLFFPRDPLFARQAHNIEATRGLVRFTVDPRTAPEQRFRDDDRRLLLQGDLPSLVLDFEDDLIEMEKQRIKETLTVVSVVLFPSTPEQTPEISWEPPVLRVGDQRYELRDGVWRH